MKDNHVHLDLIDDNLVNIIERAKKAGVNEFVVPGIYGFPKKLEELKKYPEVNICWGIYPEYAEKDDIFEKEFQKLKESKLKIFAIGECGLDKRFPFLEKQISLFKKQVELAISFNLPLIIHLVGYYQKAFDILKDFDPRPDFIIHSWTGSAQMAKEFVKLGGKISLSASILRNPKKLIELFNNIDKNKIIFETDSPDQKPDFVVTPWNEPANLPIIVKKILEIVS